MSFGEQFVAISAVSLALKGVGENAQAVEKALADAAAAATATTDVASAATTAAKKTVDDLVNALEAVTTAFPTYLEQFGPGGSPLSISDGALAVIFEAFIRAVISGQPTLPIEQIWQQFGGYNRFHFTLADIYRYFRRTGSLPETFAGSNFQQALTTGKLG